MTTIVKHFNSYTSEEKDKIIRNAFESEGYVVADSRRLKVTDKAKLISPEGHRWDVSYDTFRNGVRCPLDSNKSWGERCVGSILKQNGIPFKAQKTILHTDGSKQYMDFYLEHEGVKYDIEYHGRQHYIEDSTNRLFKPLSEQQVQDEKKKNFCEYNNIVYIEIPYSINKVKDIAQELHKFIPGIDTQKEYTVQNFSVDKAIADYYMTHTEEETAEKFDVCGATVRKTAYKLGMKKKGNYEEEAILAYYKTHTAKETAEKYGVTKYVVDGIARKHKVRKGGKLA